MSKSVIAVFPDGSLAQEAILDLDQHGFRPGVVEVTQWAGRNPETVVDELEGRNVPHDRAEVYAEAVRRGAVVVVADTNDEIADETAQVLDSHGSIDIERSAQRWQSEGWQGYTKGAELLAVEEQERERQRLSDEKFAVIEEEVKVGKREVEQVVRVRSLVTERPVTEQVRLHEEHIEVTREPVSEPLSTAEAERAFQEGEVVVTAVSEEPVIEKQARVVEEVHVQKEAEERTEQITETERRRDIQVEPTETTTKPRH